MVVMPIQSGIGIGVLAFGIPRKCSLLAALVTHLHAENQW